MSLLLYSLAEFFPLIEQLLPDRDGLRVVEIGGGHGALGQRFEKLVQNGRVASFVIIDPTPSDAVERLAQSERFSLIRQPSLEALRELDLADLYLVDGDHNYYTVRNELEILLSPHSRATRAPLILVHDVGWPWGRRDIYFEPERIPERYRQPHTYAGGVTPDSAAVGATGFSSQGEYAMAMKSGGPENGVLTAVEDAVEAFPGWEYHLIPAIFGLAVLYFTGSEAETRVRAASSSGADRFLLELLEDNRVRQHLRIAELEERLRQLEDRRTGPSSLRDE